MEKTKELDLKPVGEAVEIAARNEARLRAQQSLIGLFIALENATGDSITALEVIDKVTESINADPELSKQVFTPENIEKVMHLKRKADAGKISLNDVENAFPIIAEKVPFWSVVKTFMK